MSGVLWRRHVAARDNDLQTGAASFDCRCRGPCRSGSPPLFILSVFLFLLFLFSFFAPFVILLYMRCLSNSFVVFILSLPAHFGSFTECFLSHCCPKLLSQCICSCHIKTMQWKIWAQAKSPRQV